MSKDKRRAQRYRCHVATQIRVRGKNYNGFIVDLSMTGMRLLAERSASVGVGDRVEVFSEDLGAMTGSVQWLRSGSFGLRLEESSNTRAKFEAFRKNFITG
jgi:hypothetical protein